jgi:hypothetical protein
MDCEEEVNAQVDGKLMTDDQSQAKSHLSSSAQALTLSPKPPLSSFPSASSSSIVLEHWQIEMNLRHRLHGVQSEAAANDKVGPSILSSTSESISNSNKTPSPPSIDYNALRLSIMQCTQVKQLGVQKQLWLRQRQAEAEEKQKRVVLSK